MDSSSIDPLHPLEVGMVQEDLWEEGLVPMVQEDPIWDLAEAMGSHLMDSQGIPNMDRDHMGLRVLKDLCRMECMGRAR